MGDQLDETDDALNDDTFGGGSTSKKPVANDFDFFGRTAKVSDAITEEQARFSRQQPPSRVAPVQAQYIQPAPKPSRTGYERYREPDYIPDMQVDANLWGVTPKKPVAPSADPPSASGQPSGGRKMMSLEEVEAAMRAQATKPAQVQQPVDAYQQTPPPSQYTQPPHQDQHSQFPGQFEGPGHDEQRQQQPIHILQRPQKGDVSQPPNQPRHIMQNPNRHPSEQHFPPHLQQQHGIPPQHRHQIPQGPAQHHQGHQQRGSNNRNIITHPQQLANLSEEDRAAFLKEDAKRAKRNHKIFLLSKDNGLMTPQDKNFITRIQLQQLVTATGNPNEHGSDSSLAEDFYYQVHNSIQGASRQHPGQPLSNFAQTYLFQTGGRHGNMRRGARGGDNHVQRMAQQVQRAVEAAKNKPKNKQLVIEGSLGKISFSNAKTPKPLLNFKRTEPEAAKDRKTQRIGGNDRKSALRNIERIYDILMKVEQHAQQMPFSENESEPNAELDEWKVKETELRVQLWDSLKVHEPIGETPVHPFIAIISYNKGKKAIPRVYRHISKEQRTTILTMIIVHLDQLDVIREGVLAPGELQPRTSIRETIETFNVGIMNPLFNFLNEVGLPIVSGLVGLICNLNVYVIARTRIGVSILAMLLARAELIRSSGEFSDGDWQDW